MNSETMLRIEHKLDVLINYLHGMTNVPPADIPRPLPSRGGLTDGTCPITGTPIIYNVDPVSGQVVRTDGLDSGMRATSPLAIPEPQPWQQRPAMTDSAEVQDD
jgi:hypothetical protein